MLETLRQNLAAGLQHLSVRLQRAGTIERLPHHECPVLIFFHGYSLAHTIRPLVVGRVLRARGYPVEFAGVGPHAARSAAEGFQVYAEACAAAHVWLGAMYATWGKRYDAILNWKQAQEIFRQLGQIEQAENLEKMIAGSPL